MIKKFGAISLLIFLFVLSSCVKDKTIENLSLIDYDSDSSFVLENAPAVQPKNLLLQEFTGVWCYTCPLAHDTVAKIISMYPDRIAAMNVHSHLYSIYDDPAVMGNLYDFRTLDGDTVVTMLGGILSVPSAAIDMTLIVGEDRILSQKRENWVDYVTQMISVAPKINVEMAAFYYANESKLKIVARYTALEDISQPVYHNIAIAENNIVDWQYVGTVYVENYSHKHILRDYLYDPKGELLAAKMSRNQVEVRVNYIKVPSDWNIFNLDIIGFAHNKGSDWEVYQAQSITAFD